MTNNCEIDDKIFYNKYNYPNLFFIVKKNTSKIISILHKCSNIVIFLFSIYLATVGDYSRQKLRKTIIIQVVFSAI